MDYEQLQKYQQSLLDRALNEAVRRNEEQTQTWSEYKERHAKVAESLNIFPRELTVECMVPIGKKALMRGKLTRTNEILVSLGEGYFVKYSASQARALCDRRIKRADDILESLKKERDLYEMRRKIPECFDAFGNEERKDTIEHWDAEKLNQWRIEHRQREKEYRKRLAESKRAEKLDIKTEDDLFARLDALELQEELEEELHRLEAERPDFYSQELDEDETGGESSDSTNETEDKSDEEVSKNDEISRNPVSPTEDDSGISKIAEIAEDPRETSETSSSSRDVDSDSDSRETRMKISPMEKPENAEISLLRKSKNRKKKNRRREKRVIFGESQVKYFNKDEKVASTMKENEKTMISDEEDEDDDSSDDGIVRIEFKHSENEPAFAAGENEERFASPADIRRFPVTPKPILKNFEASKIRVVETALPTDGNNDDDKIVDDNSAGVVSAYDTIVKDVRECVIDGNSSKNTDEDNAAETTRPVSRFKRERMKR